MPGMRELRQRLRSVQSVAQMTEALYTASSAKYSQVNRLRSRFLPFAQGCESMYREVGGDLSRSVSEVRPRDALVLLGSNRGMCGGFNAELMRFFDELSREGKEAPLVFAGSKMAAAHLRERGIPFEEQLLPDVPAHKEARSLARRLLELYRSGEAERVIFVYQRPENLLLQVPAARQLLPAEKNAGQRGEGTEPLYLPDRTVIGERLAELCLESAVYKLILDNASGAQAATMMAMRTASDNARQSAAKLTSTINRRRQAEVTASVIETAGGMTQGE